MRRALAVTGLAAGLALSFVPSANAAQYCEYEISKVCVPSWCFTLAHVVSTANEALGNPLTDEFPQCID